MDDNKIADIKRIDIREVVSRLGGLGLDRNLQGNCPTGHESKGGQCFSINTKGNYFLCFHCGKGGDVIDLVKLAENKTFREAIDWFRDNFNINNGEGHKVVEANPKAKELLQELYGKDILYELVFQMGKELLYTDEGKQALDYLIESRGYKLENLKQTDWIYFPTDKEIRDYLRSQRPEADKQISILGLQGAYGDRFRLAFPYKNRDGLITGYVKRMTEPKGIQIGTTKNVRWDSTVGLTKDDLFNLCNCRDSEHILIAEGYPDALYLPTLGFKNIVAIGQGAIGAKHVDGIKALGIEKVTICLDNDKAGIENTPKAVEKFKDSGIQVYVMNPTLMGDHKDPDEYVKANGIDAFRQLYELAEIVNIDTSSKSEYAIVSGNLEADLKPIKPFKLTDYGNAERLVYYHGDNLRYCHDLKKWFIWDGIRWNLDTTGDIIRLAKNVCRFIYKEAGNCDDSDDRKAIANHAKSTESDRRIHGMIELAQSEIEVSILQAQLDSDDYLFNVLNGTIDLETGELLEHKRENLITKLSPVNYDSDAKLDLWDDFLNTVTNGNEGIKAFLQQAVGYSLTGDTAEEYLFFVHGRSATGKSTFVESVKAVMGDYATTADFESFLKRKEVGGVRNDIASLAGARLVTSIEVDEGKALAEGLIKMLTGGDTVRARFLYHEGFDFLPKMKLWLCANHEPKVNHDDDAMWRRVLKVPFKHVIPIEDRDSQVKKTLRDVSIAGPAILAWAVKGCGLYAEKGKLCVPEDVTKATTEYRNSMDTMKPFIEERCIIKVGIKVAMQTLFNQYQGWCIDYGIEPETKSSFGNRLRDSYGITSDIGAQNVYIWKGIGLRAFTVPESGKETS